MKTSTIKTTSSAAATTTTATTDPTTIKREENTNKSNDTHNKCNNMTTNVRVATTTRNCKDMVQNELNMTTATITRNHHYHHHHHLQYPHQQQHLQLPQQQLDKMSVHSNSSEDISTTDGGKCCSAAARNPAIKTGRRIQLMQVIIAQFFC